MTSSLSGVAGSSHRAGCRSVRSFVRRDGRLTVAQRRALDELLPRYAIDHCAGVLDFAGLFGNFHPVVVEIGFGSGSLLAWQARHHAEVNFIGIEVYRPGVGHLLRLLDEQDSRNVRIFCLDAMDVLENHIPPRSLFALWLFFPDPWPKKRHHKRRIVSPEFVERVAGLLLPDGVLHIATDWSDYARHIEAVVAADGRFVTVSDRTGYPFVRPQTRFERRGLRRGYVIHDLLYRLS